MQRLILPPELPAHAAVHFAAHYQTSRHAGGDYYDVLPLGRDRFGVMVADVSGHGAPAAIVMAMIRAALHSHPATHDQPPAVLETLNEHFMFLWDTAMFSTAIYATVDAAERTLRLSCAGHPPPLLLRPGHGVAALAVDAVPPLLLMPLAGVPCSTFELSPGDRVVFYTDGITERIDARGEMIATLETAGPMSTGGLLARVVDDVEAFAGGHEPEDDQTLVVLGVD
jgi:sigma-B regulation protein RsbU (phosphoserine phosphatase)